MQAKAITMKGYTEDRGLIFRLHYDGASGQFVSKPVAHAFAPQTVEPVISHEPRKMRKQTAPRARKLRVRLPEAGAEPGDDAGMTDVFAVSDHAI
jgi:hypothetical protein